MKKPEGFLEKFADDCIDCGVCQNVCTLLDDLGLTPGEIARQVVDGDIGNDVLEAIQRCALCGLCSQECLVNLNPSEMFMHARQLLMQRGLMSQQDYEIMLVDQDWNFFSIYRDTYGIKYDDLKLEKYDTLFFPGCTLSSYAPQITHSVHQWLAESGSQVGFTEMCCGKPLVSIGLGDRKDRMLTQLEEQMRRAGASRLVTACPNCFHLLDGQFGDIQVVLLYDLFNEAGMQFSGESSITIHDSCPDRYGLQAGKAVRQLLSGYQISEMVHHGETTICCGSGGIVSMVDPDLCECRAKERMSEFQNTGADTCVTACMACSHRLARAANPGDVTHCLELVFDQPIDYEQIYANIQAMWEGEWGEYNLYRLSQAKIITSTGEQTHEQA